MIGKVFKCPKEVIESGLFIVVGRDYSPEYNSTRKPWFVQVREWLNGQAVGTWIPVTLEEFKKWNPDAKITSEQWVSSGNKGGTPELC